MGLCFGKNSNNITLVERINALENDPRRDNLEERLKSLESHADLDGDGTVSRQEMETYMATQLKFCQPST